MPKATLTTQSPEYSTGKIRSVGSRIWLEDETDQFPIWKKAYAEWLSRIEKFEKLAHIHLVQNKEMDWLDLRQHRALLFNLLARGDSLFLKLVVLLNKTEKIGREGISLEREIETRQNSLLHTLNEWHGTLKSQTDLPPELLQGFKDIDEGHVVDLDVALEKTFPV